MEFTFIHCVHWEEISKNYDARRKPVKAADRKPGPYPYYGAQGIVDYVDDCIFDGLFVLVAEDGENLRTRNQDIAFMACGKILGEQPCPYS